MKRRDFITLLGGAAAAWPLAARAQQSRVPVIGVLHAGTPGGYAPFIEAFRAGLNDMGFVQDRNVAIEFRWAESHYDRLLALGNDLARRNVAVIAALGSTEAALAAKAATNSIPTVFAIGADPVDAGLVASLNRPGGNLTGISLLTVTVVAKRLELLHELVPTATLIGFLVNPTDRPRGKPNEGTSGGGKYSWGAPFDPECKRSERVRDSFCYSCSRARRRTSGRRRFVI
jgi:putative ABC transport system substrate-binding protein